MRGFYGVGIYLPKKEINIGTLFRTAFSFGTNYIFTIGKRYTGQGSDTCKSYRHMPLYHYPNMRDFLKWKPYNTELIGVEQSYKAKPLQEFSHPERAMYLLGAEDYGLPEEILDKCKYIIEITGGKYCLNVGVAGSIVIYDRYIKRVYYGNSCEVSKGVYPKVWDKGICLKEQEV